MLTRAVRRRSEPRGDDGFTLVELLVSMAIFSILLMVFTAGITSMSRTTTRVTNTGEASTELSRLYNRLDKEVPYAAAINRPVPSGGGWYLEYFTKSTPTGTTPFCTQYRYVPSTRSIEVRRWNESGTLGLTAWTTLARDVVARGSGSPLVMLPADSTYARQRLQVAVDVVQPQTPVQQLDTTFVARNTSIDTGTNADGDGNGVSDSQICTSQGVGRP